MSITRKIYYFIGTVVTLFAGFIHYSTAQRSVSFWDCGEVAAAAHGLQVPHPPGSPIHTIMAKVFSLIPLAENIGFRMNLFSVFTSMLSVLLLYLIIIKLIELIRRQESITVPQHVMTYLSAAIGALALAFSHSFWFNATESEIYATNTFSFAVIMYLILRWNERSEDPDATKYILAIAFVVGLTTGIRMFGVLTIITVTMIVMFKKYVEDQHAAKISGYILLGHVALLLTAAAFIWNGETGTTPPSMEEYKSFDTKFKLILAAISVPYMAIFWRKIFNRNSIYIALIVGAVAKFVIFDIIVKKIPETLGAIAETNWNTAAIAFFVLFAILGFAVYYADKNKKEVLHTLALSIMMILIGYSAYSTIIIRSNQTPPMNENEPNDFTELVSYLNRTQYGDWPTFKRRFATEPHQMGVYSNYSSDLDFWWRYQMNHMMTRYILWTYGGRENWVQDAGPNIWPFNGLANALLSKLLNLRFNGDSHNSFFGIPFLVGLIGIFYHFRKDWKTASAFFILFIIVSYLFAFYQNQQEPQPRERDKFLAPLGFVFAIWIGIGIRGLADKITQYVKAESIRPAIAFVVLALGFVFIPLRMAQANYHEHDRSKNWIPWDLAYNMLQSCAPNAILITNGDNDTFPLWYLQDVEGIRRDIRIVNLSLGNTPWYIYQLKNYEPYGTPKVKISIPDDQLNDEMLRPVAWEATDLSIDVPRDFDKRSVNYRDAETRRKWLSVTGKNVFDEYAIKDSSVIREGKLTWKMQPTISSGDVQGIRVQDILVKDIVQQNNWERPVYFSMTCSEDCKIGLSDYLKIEGITLRLVPEKKQPSLEFVNEELTAKHLLFENPGFSKEYQPGFKYRNIHTGELHLDDNQSRLLQNYRTAYIRFALYYYNNLGQKAKGLMVLNTMEKKIPHDKVEMDFRLLYDVANLHRQGGDAQTAQKLSQVVERQALEAIEKNPSDVQGYYNPYKMLVEIYEQQKAYGKAADIMTRLSIYYPNDPGIKSEIQRLKSMQK